MFKYWQNKRNDICKISKIFLYDTDNQSFLCHFLLKYIYIEIFFNSVQKHVILTATRVYYNGINKYNQFRLLNLIIK